MYYLQSRYYNPEWGRFINADGIAANTGELLSGNMFAYCKNNTVNMHDNDGERPDFGDGTGRETNDERELSLACMSSVNMNRYQQKHKYDTLKSDAISSAIMGALPSTIDSGTACAMAAIHNPLKFNPIPQQSLPGGGISPQLYAYNREMPLLSVARTGYKFLGGVATGVAFLYCAWDDCHHSHSAGRIFIDAAGVGLGIFIGAILSPLELPVLAAVGVSALVGFGIGMGTSYIKREAYGD